MPALDLEASEMQSSFGSVWFTSEMNHVDSEWDEEATQDNGKHSFEGAQRHSRAITVLARLTVRLDWFASLSVFGFVITTEELERSTVSWWDALVLVRNNRIRRRRVGISLAVSFGVLLPFNGLFVASNDPSREFLFGSIGYLWIESGKALALSSDGWHHSVVIALSLWEFVSLSLTLSVFEKLNVTNLAVLAWVFVRCLSFFGGGECPHARLTRSWLIAFADAVCGKSICIWWTFAVARLVSKEFNPFLGTRDYPCGLRGLLLLECSRFVTPDGVARALSFYRS